VEIDLAASLTAPETDFAEVALELAVAFLVVVAFLSVVFGVFSGTSPSTSTPAFTALGVG
jgi:hypothetical protein